MMIRLAYVSTATESFSSGDVFKIVETSARNNAASGLTGFLIFSENRFFQVIEGTQEAIDALYRRIEKDPRHRSVSVVHSCAINERAFPRWKMKRIPAVTRPGKLPQLPDEISAAPEPIRRAVEDFLRLAEA